MLSLSPLQGLKGDFPLSLESSASCSDLCLDCLSLFSCSRSLKASNLNLFLGARHMGEREDLLEPGLDSDLESGEMGLGLRDSEL